MTDTLEKINQSVWELQNLVKEKPGEIGPRIDLLNFFHESRLFVERRAGIPDEERSFLLMQKRESLCCLLIHGAGGSPAEMRPLGEHLFRLGYTVYGVRLPLDPKSSDYRLRDYFSGIFGVGKGDGKERKRIEVGNHWSVCLSQVEIVLGTLLSYSPSTYVVGFSFGGTIALDIVRNHPVRGTVLIAPGIFPSRGSKYFLFRMWKSILPSVAREIAPVKSTMIDFVDRTRSGFAPIKEPVLVIQAADDPVVSTRGFHFLKRHCLNPNSEFVLINDGGHVLVNGAQSEKVFALCSDFIRKV